MPQAVDTPIYQNAGNYTGRQVRPVPPLARRARWRTGSWPGPCAPRAEVSYGLAARGLSVLSAVPPLYRRIVPAAFMRGTFTGEPVSPSDGNLFEPVGPDADAQGTWRRTRPRSGLWGRAHRRRDRLRRADFGPAPRTLKRAHAWTGRLSLVLRCPGRGVHAVDSSRRTPRQAPPLTRASGRLERPDQSVLPGAVVEQRIGAEL